MEPNSGTSLTLRPPLASDPVQGGALQEIQDIIYKEERCWLLALSLTAKTYHNNDCWLLLLLYRIIIIINNKPFPPHWRLKILTPLLR